MVEQVTPLIQPQYYNLLYFTLHFMADFNLSYTINLNNNKWILFTILVFVQYYTIKLKYLIVSTCIFVINSDNANQLEYVSSIFFYYEL